jgi:hypothetical protein
MDRFLDAIREPWSVPMIPKEALAWTVILSVRTTRIREQISNRLFSPGH